MATKEFFGHFELLGRINSGGMAEVYRARDLHTNQIVALKRILRHIAEDPDFIKMFEDEALLVRRFSHPHIARLLDSGMVDGRPYIAFEFVDGHNLREVFDVAEKAGEKLPIDFLTYVFSRIGEGLSYVHARKDDAGLPVQIVHRDVSPQNIVLSFEGDVKLIDFGIAKTAEHMGRTQNGVLKGKFGYMSPEQVLGKTIDARTDVFALGICMWELFTGKRLFSGPSEPVIIKMVREHAPARPSAIRADIPEKLDQIILKALAKNPQERYRSARELYKDLNGYSASSRFGREQVASLMQLLFEQDETAWDGQPYEPPSSDPPTADGKNPRSLGARAQVDRASPGGNQAEIWGASARKSAMGPIMQLQESRMSDDNNGSDLDIFEGLGKKSGKIAAVAPPPPPRSSNSGMPAAPVSARPSALSSLSGPSAPPAVPQAAPTSPSAASPSPSAPPPSGMMRAVTAPMGNPSSASKPPPPPPGRASLPNLGSSPPVAAAKPAGNAGTALAVTPKNGAHALDMDWDDENEETHVFDKEASKASNVNATMEADIIEDKPTLNGQNGAANDGMPKVLPAGKKTLLGLNGMAVPPPPPPPTAGRVSAPPPPPPPVSQRLAPVPLPSAPPVPTPPVTQRLDEMAGQPGQQSTAPLAMPPSQHMQSAAPAQQQPQFPAPSQHPSAPPPSQDFGVPAQQQSMPPMMSTRQMEATQLVRPSGEGSRTGLLVGVGLLALAAVAGFAVYMAVPRTGRIIVNAQDARGTGIDQVDVYLDGKKQCDTTPCTIDQVGAGDHVVKVSSQGYEASMKNVTLEARKSQTLDFALISGAGKASTGVKVAGSQPSVRLYVDGREIGPLPQEVRDLVPGDHKVRFAGSERYAPVERTITVTKDEMVDLGQVNLHVLKGKVTVQLGTPGAKVFIVTGTERHEVTPIPIALEIDTSKPARLEASKPGFNDYALPVTFDDGQAEKSITVTLDAKSTGSGTTASNWAPPPSNDSPAPAPQPRPQPKNNAAAAPDPMADDPKPAQPAAQAPATSDSFAFLTLNSLPASTVLVDGKPVGQTPKVKLPVSAGSHTITFVNADQQLKKTMTVQVGAGETKPVIAKLRDQ